MRIQLTAGILKLGLIYATQTESMLTNASIDLYKFEQNQKKTEPERKELKQRILNCYKQHYRLDPSLIATLFNSNLYSTGIEQNLVEEVESEKSRPDNIKFLSIILEDNIRTENKIRKDLSSLFHLLYFRKKEKLNKNGEKRLKRFSEENDPFYNLLINDDQIIYDPVRCIEEYTIYLNQKIIENLLYYQKHSRTSLVKCVSDALLHMEELGLVLRNFEHINVLPEQIKASKKSVQNFLGILTNILLNRTRLLMGILYKKNQRPFKEDLEKLRNKISNALANFNDLPPILNPVTLPSSSDGTAFSEKDDTSTPMIAVNYSKKDNYILCEVYNDSSIQDSISLETAFLKDIKDSVRKVLIILYSLYEDEIDYPFEINSIVCIRNKNDDGYDFKILDHKNAVDLRIKGLAEDHKRYFLKTSLLNNLLAFSCYLTELSQIYPDYARNVVFQSFINKLKSINPEDNALFKFLQHEFLLNDSKTVSSSDSNNISDVKKSLEFVKCDAVSSSACSTVSSRVKKGSVQKILTSILSFFSLSSLKAALVVLLFSIFLGILFYSFYPEILSYLTI